MASYTILGDADEEKPPTPNQTVVESTDLLPPQTEGKRRSKATILDVLDHPHGKRFTPKEALLYGASSMAMPGPISMGSGDAVPHSYLTKPIEDWEQGDAIWFAGQMGMADTFRGI